MPNPTLRVERGQLEAQFVPGTYNAEKHTIDVVWTTGARGLRVNWWTGEKFYEELEVSERAVRMGRLQNKASVLNTHKRHDLSFVMGVVDTAWLAGGQGLATVRFSQREDVKPYEKDVADGIITKLSCAYDVFRYEKVGMEGDIPVYRATDWEPDEISFVSVAFDDQSTTRNAEPPKYSDVEVFMTRQADSTQPAAPGGPIQEEQRTMAGLNNTTGGTPAPAPAPLAPEVTRTAEAAPPAPPVSDAHARAAGAQAERTRIAEIRKAVRAAGLDEAFGEDLIERGVELGEARAAVINKMAERDAQTPTRNVNPGASARVTRDENETRSQAMTDALYLRMNPNAARTMAPEALERAREYRHMSLLRMAEESLERGGMRVRGMTPLEIATHVLRAQSTSDFPNLMSSLTNRRLREAYEANPGTYQRWARRAPNAPDFRNINVVQVGAVPAFAQVKEGGTVNYGVITDGATSYQVLSYYSGLSFTRQAIINDDLRGLDQAIRGFAAAGNRLENALVYAQLTSNPNMADGVALFHADHGNLAAASAIAVASLGEGRSKMRLQKGLQDEVLNLTPSFLIVPSALEQLAYQYTSSQFVPAKSSDVNEFRAGGRTSLEPIVEPILDATSASQWYMAAANSSVDTVEFCWLEGSEGVYTESMVDFDSDGIKIKARDDFGAKVVDHRGLFRNG